jgi:hypothetical protein
MGVGGFDREEWSAGSVENDREERSAATANAAHAPAGCTAEKDESETRAADATCFQQARRECTAASIRPASGLHDLLFLSSTMIALIYAPRFEMYGKKFWLSLGTKYALVLNTTTVNFCVFSLYWASLCIAGREEEEDKERRKGKSEEG